MYMSQLAYKTVAFTLILDPRPSYPESVAEHRIRRIIKHTSQNHRSTDRFVGPRPKSVSYHYEFARRK